MVNNGLNVVQHNFFLVCKAEFTLNSNGILFLVSYTFNNIWGKKNCSHFKCTVKPVYNDHTWDFKIVVVVDRGFLFRGTYKLRKRDHE